MATMHTSLASEAELRRWCMGKGRNLTFAALEEYVATTGRGVQPDVLADVALAEEIYPDSFQWARLTRNSSGVAPRQAIRSIMSHLHQALTPRYLTVGLPQDVKSLDGFHQVELVTAWRSALTRLGDQVHAAATMSAGHAPGSAPVDRLTYEDLFEDRPDPATVARWAQQARVAAEHSEKWLAATVGLEVPGLEVVVDDRLVRASADLR